MPRLRLVSIGFLLVMLTPWLALGQASDGDSGKLRAAAERLLADGSADDAVKAADLLDKASQIEARAADIANDDAQSKTLEQEIENGLVPLISTLVLAATLVFNIVQARIAARDKRADDNTQQEQARADRLRQDQQDQDKRFNDALELMLKSENFSPAAALIGSFVDGPYRDRARAAGLSLMHKTQSLDTFKDLFTTMLMPVTYDNLPQVMDLLRGIQAALQPLLRDAWTGTSYDNKKLRPDKADTYNLLLAERYFVSPLVGVALRKPRPDPACVLDISGAGFDGADFSGLDLRGASIDPASWIWVNLDCCDLRGIATFGSTYFDSTVWWHAKAIDPPFLEYLVKTSPYKEGGTYPKAVSQADYDEQVARLRRGLVD